MRAAEAVIVAYYELPAGKPWPYNQRDWGRYVEELRKHDAPDKIIEILDQTRKNYRNPLLHPDESLNQEEALRLFGMVLGVLSLLLQEIKVKKS